MVAYQEFMYSIIQIEDQNERDSVQLDERLLCYAVFYAMVMQAVHLQHSLHINEPEWKMKRKNRMKRW